MLLLNTVLTVRAGQAFSHRDKGWEQFTDRIISLLNDRTDPLVFILWGAASRKKRALITNGRHEIVESPHPSPALRSPRFSSGSQPFSRANALLHGFGAVPVAWELTG